MNQMLRMVRLYYSAAHLPEYLAPALDLGMRLFLGNIFFKSGLTKIKTWDSTLYLFNDVYEVPLLDPQVAAWLATSAELGLPVLLVLGLFGRFAASGLFILNAVAVVSYYPELSEAGLNQHLYWGILLMVLLVASRGAWSVDAWLERQLQKSA
jgi:putative oxidoreductase